MKFQTLFVLFCCLKVVLCGLKNESATVRKRSTPNLNEICGKSSVTPGLQSLISFGQTVTSEQWPWMGALYHGAVFICGGSIVSEKLIVTAAHCIIDKDQYVKRQASQLIFIVGKTDLTDHREQNFQLLSIAEIVLHPNWDAALTTYEADIALAILKTPITFSKNILPVCVPPFDSLQYNVKGAVAGWGATEASRQSTVLKLAKLAAVDRQTCIKSDDFFSQVMSSSTFCTELSESGPCSGDSGGGYAQKINDRWTLMGIVSFTISNSCKEKHHIGFTDVTKFTDWIKDHMGSATEGQVVQTNQNQKITDSNADDTCGAEAPNSWPWVASIYHEHRETTHCTGTLISKTAVITKGICDIGPIEYFYVVLGDQDRSKRNSFKYFITKFVHHPEVLQYKYNNVLLFDHSLIAIAFLHRPVEFNEIVRPICMFNQITSNTRGSIGMVLEFKWEEERGVVDYRARKLFDQFDANKNSVDIPLQPDLYAQTPDSLFIKVGNKWFFWGFALYGVHLKDNTMRYQNLKVYKNWIEQELGKSG